MSTESANLHRLPVPTPMAQTDVTRRTTFAGAIFVSAFLLFQVQPLIGKFILPWFGGSPAVWTTCMLFFQVTLFLGYAYAHATTRWLSERHQRTVHLALIAGALAVLPIAPDAVWKPLDSEHPTARILLLLAATVGLPYFVLSATGPLLQAWFSRVCRGNSPYRLYSLSNVASLLALVSYPLIVEPLWSSTLQASVWSGVFLLFAWLGGTCAIWVGETLPHVASRASDASVGTAPSLGRRTLWLLLPACSCLMLLATTNEVTTDVAPVPFLWVVPLGLYLLSFVICFDREAWYRRDVVAPLTALSLLLVAGLGDWPDWLGLSLTMAQELGFYFVALFGVCMVCHGEVVRLRPSPKYLTEFYLMLSAGGALGGIFVSLIAPQLFTTYFEWSLGLLASFLTASVVATLALRERLTRSSSTNNATHDEPVVNRVWLVSPGALVAASLAVELVALGQIAVWQFTFAEATYRSRNFYGTVRVHDLTTDSNEPFRAFLSGSINHGCQWTLPEKRRLPTTYYGEGTALSQAVALVQSRPRVHIGAVGMGIGTLATYSRPTDTVRFYEINPEVDLIARKYFTFLSDCQGRCDVVLGDARLMLEREEPNQFDLLFLDAFTGDAPPVHLLTKEAFQLYGRHLRPDGLLVVHVTNTYLELAPVVARIGHELGWKLVRVRTPFDETWLANHTDSLIFAREATLLPQSPSAETIPDDVIRAAPLWTDQYSNLIQVLKRD
jgi:hypothetical protein